jgi:hypothetical protein
MSIADEIIYGLEPDYDRVIQEGYTLDDMDEYGFTPLIESVICERLSVTEALIQRRVSIDEPDVLKRTALHWAVDQGLFEFAKLLLKSGANPNTFDSNGLSALVYPILRGQYELKHLLFQYGAKLDFALDFIHGKLLGHRFELKGRTEILAPNNEFVELDYEGFILEFTVATLKDSLRRFTSSYSTRHLRSQFKYVTSILDGLITAEKLLRYQHHQNLSREDKQRISMLIQSTPLLILPAASRGHAMCFMRMKNWWVKIDRGEHSLQEGSANIYQMMKPDAFNFDFLKEFLYQRHPREYFHQQINRELGLKPLYKLPLTSQIAGNCSWANIQGVVALGYALQQLDQRGSFLVDDAMVLYHNWIEWDQDRALDDCIQRFYMVDKNRKFTIASMLGAVLFQACDAKNSKHVKRAEKILKVLTLPEYSFILDTYLTHYCVKCLTPRGNNLLKLLDDSGVNTNIEVTPIATGLKERK